MTALSVDEVASALAKIVQGQVFGLNRLMVMSTRRGPVHPAAQAFVGPGKRAPSEGLELVLLPLEVETGKVMLVTQTCDLQPRQTSGGRTNAHVAPIVGLDGAALRDALAGLSPRFVPVPWLGPGLAADLDQVTPVDRAVLALCERGPSPEETQRRALAAALGRVYARAALPDEVVKVLETLRRTAVDAKDSAVRRVFDEAIVQIRVMPDAAYHADEGCAITVLILLEADWYPEVEPAKFRDTGKDPVAIAPLIVDAYESGDDSRAGELMTLWGRLRKSLEDRLLVRAQSHSPSVTDVTVRLETALTPAEYETSDVLDLTYLTFAAEEGSFGGNPD